MRVVLDTNLIVSQYLSPQGSPAAILQKWEAEVFTVLVSQPILAEYQAVLHYERLKQLHKLTDEEIAEAVAQFTNFAELVAVPGTLQVIKDDPDDDKFVECAVIGRADYIVSGNKHLLRLQTYEGIQVLTPAVFLALLSS